MKNLILLLVLFLSQQALCKIKFEKGVDNTVHWADPPVQVLQLGSGQRIKKNIYHQNKSYARSLETDIQFKEPFDTTPQVAISVTTLDFTEGTPSGFSVEAIEVTRAGFKLRYYALMNTPVNTVQVAWFATNDPLVEAQNYQSTESLPKNSKSNGSERFVLVPLTFTKTYEQPPQVAVFLTGLEIQQRNNIIRLQVQDVTPTGCNVKVSTWFTTFVGYYAFTAVIAPVTKIYAREVQYRVPDYSDNWASSYPPMERPKTVTDKITELQFKTGSRVEFYGLSALDVDDYKNTRLTFKDFVLARDSVTFDMATWWDSQVYQLNANYFIYSYDNKDTSGGQDCAVLYSQCDFEGESYSICDRQQSLPSVGWNKLVKSVKVPQGKVLKVFNQENFAGKIMRFEGNNNCLVNVKFTFAQVMFNLHEQQADVKQD